MALDNVESLSLSGQLPGGAFRAVARARGDVEQVADAAVASHPEWVIQTRRQQADPIMDGGKAQYYGAAANWLRRARSAHLAAGQEKEWQSYLAGLLERHGRKHKLVPMLKALK